MDEDKEKFRESVKGNSMKQKFNGRTCFGCLNPLNMGTAIYSSSKLTYHGHFCKVCFLKFKKYLKSIPLKSV